MLDDLIRARFKRHTGQHLDAYEIVLLRMEQAMRDRWNRELIRHFGNVARGTLA